MITFSTPILVVDDDALSRRLLARALEKSGFRVIQCASGSEALEMVEAGEPMLLVLDYSMPDLTGAQVCERVRGHIDPAISSLPIILLTAHSGEEHELECLAAGADDFVTKPVNTAILKARIETHLRLHALRAQLREQNTELERWRARHEFDLDAARLTQQAILPARPPVIAGWQLAAHYQPLIQVGGDIYDWLRLSDGSWLVWIADATGHGAAAALLTTFTKLVFRHAAMEGKSAREILDAVNAEVFSVFKGRSFLTAACVVLRPDSNEVCFSGAGHPPLLVVRRDGSIQAIASQTPPIGIRATLGGSEATLRIESSDTLLLYTDGLYSMKGPAEERLTPEDAQTFLPVEAGSAAEFIQGTIAAMIEHAGEELLPDDVAAIVLRRE
jgi:phosphoserine phosphatase RsbU/P